VSKRYRSIEVVLSSLFDVSINTDTAQVSRTYP